ncbi:MAG: TonB-dependent receptor [Roseibacillus sp.]|nr:TonB-dependent receptor [Roseibacillus sp.]
MSKHPVNLTGLLVGAGCLTLNGALNAQIVRTLPETRVTASQSGGAGEGDLDETTLSPEDLERFGVETLEDLSMLAPNLHFVDSDTRGYGNIISMRGLSNTLFFGPAAVGLYVDDVPFGDAFNYSSNLLRLESARVHHGPQGASFGRNASAGLMELSTMQTTDTWKLGGSVEYGSYNSRAVTGYSSGPLADGLSHTFQFYWKERDGFVENNFLGGHADDRSVLGGLASIIWTPAPDTEIKFRVMAERVDDGSQRLTPLPFNPAFAGDLFRVNSDLRGRNETERYQLSLHGRKDFDWGTMKSITSYQSWDLGPQTVDLDLSPGSFATSLINQDQDLWTQEFRFQSSEDAGPLSWRGGLFYMNKENNGSTRRMFPAGLAGIVTEGNRFTIEEKNYAAYGKAAYDLGNGFSVEAGGRLDYTDASMSRVKTLAPFGPVPAQSPNSEGIYFSPTTGIVYAHNDNVSSFLRTGMGIKPHGYSAFSDDPATASFGEERNWSNEAGVHYNDPDSNLNVVVRAFWNVIDDYQLNAQNPFSTDFVIVNADEVRSRGLEAELQWRPIDPLLIHGNAGWTDVEFESYTDPFTGTNHDGSNVPFIPELTASAGFRYDLPGGFFFGSSVRATEDTYYDAANTGAFLQDGYWIWDAQAGYEAENWSVTVYGRNILDEEYYSFVNPQIAAGSPGDPQLFGVRVNLDLW